MRRTSHCSAYQTLTSVPHSWLKRRKIGHSIHKRLGEVVAMSRREREGTRLSEVIELSSRRQMPIWSPSRHFSGNVANSGLEHENDTENGVKWHGGSSDRVTNIPSINGQISSFVWVDPATMCRVKERRENFDGVGRSSWLCQSGRLARQLEVAREFHRLGSLSPDANIRCS